MNKTFIDFLIKAKKSTYASAQGDSKKILDDGGKEFTFLEGKYLYRDRYFGSGQFIGEEVVFFNDRAAWVMNYSGRILNKTTSEKEVYDFLKQSLMQVSEQSPFRGPAGFLSGDYKYKCEFEGNPDSFVGTETIYHKSMKVYELYFHGGMIA